MKHILFSPKANSIFCIILGIIAILYSTALEFFPIIDSPILGFFPIIYSPVLGFFAIIAIIDCIRDIKIGESFYIYRGVDSSYERDKLFNLKSLSGISLIVLAAIWTESRPFALLISMVPRVVFLLVVYPCISYSVLWSIKKKMSAGHPLHIDYSCIYPWRGISSLFYNSKKYYYDKYFYRLCRKGKLKNNIDKIESEFNLSNKKFKGQQKKTKKTKKTNRFINKITRKDFKTEFGEKYYTSKFTIAYISVKFYKKYPKRIAQAMLTRGAVNPCKIKEFEDLKDLNLTSLLGESNSWSEPFIIEALDELVKEGVVEDLDLSDEIETNHAYRHVNGVAMKSIDLNALLGEDDI